MSGNDLTIIVGVAGIIVTLGASLAFYRLGTRASHNELAVLQNMLARVVQQLREQSPDRREIEQTVRYAGGDAATAAKVASSVESSKKDAVEVLVRASLGALQDASGEVELARLLREVTGATGADYPEIASVLAALRVDGMVDWDGGVDDLATARTLRILPRNDRRDREQ